MGRSDTCCGRLGTSFRARKWRSLDPCGLLCVHLSLAVHVYALVVIRLKLIKGSSTFSSSVFFYGMYVPTATLALTSLYMAWTTNPGAVPMGARPLTTFRRASGTSHNHSTSSTSTTRGTRRCHKCNDNYKPPRAHHDSVTGRCIVKMDHYCPWVGNAIGALNHKFFVLFIFYTLLTSIQALILIVVRMVHCGYVREQDDDEPSSTDEAEWSNTQEESSGEKGLYDPSSRWLPKYVYEECNGMYEYHLVVILFVISIVFLIFTCSMLVEQWDAIVSNTGKIARMKMSVGQGGTELQRVTHAFNEMFGGHSPHVAWHWFLPIHVKFPKGMEKVVLGYEWDESLEALPYTSPDDDEEDNDDDNDDDAMVAAIIGDEPNDLESGLVVDPSVTASLGDESSDESSYSSGAAKKGVRKRQSGDYPVETTGNILT